MLEQDELVVVRSAIRTNTIIMGVTVGVLCGAILWLSTVILLLRGGAKVGLHLSLLSVFFPGYDVSWAGAWIGLLWGFCFGGVSGAILYWSYGRGLSKHISDLVIESPADNVFVPPVFRISGIALGMGLGVVLALQLLVTTNWLVLSGKAPYSKNAALLGQYLPGYTVSVQGSIVGAIELFVLAMISAGVLAAIYNRLAVKRAA